MTDTTDLDTVETAAMASSAALVLTGVVGLGVVELLDGKPYGAAPITNEAGEVVATPGVDPTLRTGLVIAGLVVLLLLGVYRAATDQRPAGEPAGTDAGATTN